MSHWCRCPNDPANLDHTYFTLAPLWCLPISENKVDLHSLWNYPWNGHRPHTNHVLPSPLGSLDPLCFVGNGGQESMCFNTLQEATFTTCPRPTTFRPPRASHGHLGTWISEISVPNIHLPASNPEMKICQNFAPPIWVQHQIAWLLPSSPKTKPSGPGPTWASFCSVSIVRPSIVWQITVSSSLLILSTSFDGRSLWIGPT